MITANVIHRMFHLKSTMSGTAFAVDVDGRQYLVTARHLVKELEPGGSISLLHQRIWKTLTVEIVGVGSDKIDVAVLACPIQLAPTLRLHPSSDGMVLGQQVHMLGFPYGWDTGQEGVNRDFPVPPS